MGGVHPDFSHRAIKQFILAYKGSVLPAGLPGKERRADLEGLAWASLDEALKYAKAQDEPELRLLAMRVVTALMRVELAILLEKVFETSRHLRITFYDAAYVALARDCDAMLITADKALYKKIKRHCRSRILGDTRLEELTA